MSKTCEPEILRGAQAVMQADPTRPTMVDGGNCLRDNSLPVNGAHYTEFLGTSFRDFPDAAYTRDHFYKVKNRGAWDMVPNRPIMKGEILFAAGYSTDTFATIGGDRCFIGMGETMQARGLWGKMLSEGYRWADVASFHFWMGNSDGAYFNSWSPVAVFCKQWNWCFGAGEKVTREMKVFNSTQHSDPIEVTWSFNVAGKKITGGTQTFNLPAGEDKAFEITFECPQVAQRSTGTLSYSAHRKGVELYTDSKELAIITPAKTAQPQLKKSELAVFDPKGTVSAYLKARGIAFTLMKDAETAPKSAKVVIIGNDAISEEQSTSSAWYSMASTGKRVIVLDQQYPLYFQATPADIKPSEHSGRFGFCENLSHPIFANLEQADFFTWGNDHIMYRNAYKKGSKGGASLVQCDDKLGYTAMVESRVGEGLLILSQLAIGERIGELAVAQNIFNNLLNYTADYKVLRKEALVYIGDNKLRADLLTSIELKYTHVKSLLDVLRGNGIAIVDASPENLKTLAKEKSKVDAFAERGGWLMLWGLNPEGLSDFNTLVDHQHVIRPFQMERVVLSSPQDALASGLTLRDVVLHTGKKVNSWMSLMHPDEEAFEFI
ncbi:MAG: hypothetical protein HRU15_13150, partial [Planctomycetes bacterium]|nr:hypothetical protein [Planctomycetota bacterium]